MKKVLLVKIILLFMSCCLILFSCSDYDDVKIKKEPTTEKDDPSQDQPSSEPTPTETEEEITISTDSSDISVGESVEYSVHLPTGKNITTMSKWSSSDESILKSEGQGEFSALESGDVDITVSYQKQSVTIKVHVYSRPETINGDKYSSLVWGIEGCASHKIDAGGLKSYKVSGTSLYCNGDCDDAYFNVFGEDITLGIYLGKLFLIANKDQNVFITSFIDNYNSWGNKNYINSNSKLNIHIKDRDGKVLSSEELTIFPATNENKNLVTKSIAVHKGEAIDFNSHWKGTKVTDNSCPSTVEFSTILESNDKNKEQAGFWLKESGIALGHQTIKVNN